MPIQESSVEHLSRLSELAPFWRRRLRFCFYTESHRIDGFVRTSCYRLVDHLNQVTPNGAVRIEEFAIRPLEIEAPASQVYDAGDLDIADIYLAVPEIVSDGRASPRNVQARTLKQPVRAIARVEPWTLTGTIYLPDDAPRNQIPVEVFPQFMVLTDVTMTGPGDLGDGQPVGVVLVNRQHLSSLHE